MAFSTTLADFTFQQARAPSSLQTHSAPVLLDTDVTDWGTQLVSTSSPPHFLGAASVCCWRETHAVRQEGAGRREDVVLANLPSGGEVGLRGQLVASGPLPAWRCDPGRARAKGVFGLKDVPVSCWTSAVFTLMNKARYSSPNQGVLGLKVVSFSFTTLEPLHSGQMAGLHFCLRQRQQAQPSGARKVRSTSERS